MRLQLLLGAAQRWPVAPSGVDPDVFRSNCGLAAWTLDKAAKNFLVACWRLREARIGTVRVVSGHATHTPGTRAFAGELARQLKNCRESDPAAQRRFWKRWIPPPVSRWGLSFLSARRCRANFYGVVGGRHDGVFYNWRDVRRSVGGLPQARVKGFDTIHDARVWLGISCYRLC